MLSIHCILADNDDDRDGDEAENYEGNDNDGSDSSDDVLKRSLAMLSRPPH